MSDNNEQLEEFYKNIVGKSFILCNDDKTDLKLVYNVQDYDINNDYIDTYVKIKVEKEIIIRCDTTPIEIFIHKNYEDVSIYEFPLSGFYFSNSPTHYSHLQEMPIEKLNEILNTYVKKYVLD